ncbi:hypothetical protein [Halobiforma nitratireducens]|uniref:Uncharacterized protein n=1 Tax=Halobiforma nitratireducens JCM 10879 TaxID=1227454 RepID=M0M0I2_9EURY|nr:hypothetical protein [Halobiforma nitratireducens]EMA38928.1 hypothetical protein C446_09058 [Halobiforma nitratireducens JCM 10879]
MKRQLVLAAISLALVAALAGCGGPGDAPEEETDGEDDPSDHPPDETDGPTDDGQPIDQPAGSYVGLDGTADPYWSPPSTSS